MISRSAKATFPRPGCSTRTTTRLKSMSRTTDSSALLCAQKQVRGKNMTNQACYAAFCKVMNSVHRRELCVCNSSGFPADARPERLPAIPEACVIASAVGPSFQVVGQGRHSRILKKEAFISRHFHRIRWVCEDYAFKFTRFTPEPGYERPRLPA